MTSERSAIRKPWLIPVLAGIGIAVLVAGVIAGAVQLTEDDAVVPAYRNAAQDEGNLCEVLADSVESWGLREVSHTAEASAADNVATCQMSGSSDKGDATLQAYVRRVGDDFLHTADERVADEVVRLCKRVDPQATTPEEAGCKTPDDEGSPGAYTVVRPLAGDAVLVVTMTTTSEPNYSAMWTTVRRLQGDVDRAIS